MSDSVFVSHHEMKQTVPREKRFSLILEDFWILCLLELKVFCVAVELFAQHVTPATITDHQLFNTIHTAQLFHLGIL